MEKRIRWIIKGKRIVFSMKKILFLPFLQISSGHHQVAEALSEHLNEIDSTLSHQKIDILNYTFGVGERLISQCYLKAIRYLPNVYSWIYKQNSYKEEAVDKQYRFYELLFIRSMKKMLAEVKPDFIICTHSLPSHMLNILKGRDRLTTPVINVYTDYFVNTVWGIREIDYHFAPSNQVKQFLEQNGVKSERIFVTGIPIHPSFASRSERVHVGSFYNVLLSGGNLGIGPLETWLEGFKLNGKINYYVLCGKNKGLYEKLKNKNHPQIYPLEYISDRLEMNDLYNKLDLVITKPGGVTLSECLNKRIPLYLLKALPGQEEWNERFFIENDLALNRKMNLNNGNLEESLLEFLENQEKKQQYLLQLEANIGRNAEVKSVLTSILKA